MSYSSEQSPETTPDPLSLRFDAPYPGAVEQEYGHDLWLEPGGLSNEYLPAAYDLGAARYEVEGSSGSPYVDYDAGFSGLYHTAQPSRRPAAAMTPRVEGRARLRRELAPWKTAALGRLALSMVLESPQPDPPLLVMAELRIAQAQAASARLLALLAERRNRVSEADLLNGSAGERLAAKQELCTLREQAAAATARAANLLPRASLTYAFRNSPKFIEVGYDDLTGLHDPREVSSPAAAAKAARTT